MCQIIYIENKIITGRHPWEGKPAYKGVIYMEYFEKIMKKTGWTSLLSSIVFAILGIILITNPEGTVKFVSAILGIMFILAGAYKIISYYQNKGKYDIMNYDIAYGIIAIILGIATIAYSEQISSIFRIIIGIWIVYSSIMRFSLALKLKTISSNIWIYSIILAICMFICGLYTIFVSNLVVVSIGVSILIYAIIDAIEDIIFLVNVNKLS